MMRAKTKSFHEFVEGLKKDGYTVKFDARLVGASGVAHHVDLLAKPGGGEGRRKLIVGLKDRRKNPIEDLITVFAIALDVGARPYYVTKGSVEDELVKRYGIVLLRPD